MNGYIHAIILPGRASTVFRRVGLEHLADRLNEEAPWDQTLSGGEKQRLAFARIFLHKPDIIVLDEATAALDPNSQDELMAHLSERPEQTTFVSVGHRPELEAFHNRKITLERRRDGAKLVSDIKLVPRPGRARLLRRRMARAVKRQAYTSRQASAVRGPRFDQGEAALGVEPLAQMRGGGRPRNRIRHSQLEILGSGQRHVEGGPRRCDHHRTQQIRPPARSLRLGTGK
jgi:ABC-type uncharacterized transport system ATPase subunit